MKLVVVATAWSILFYGSVVVSNDATSMEKFIGNWTVHHSDNFEAYLSAKGNVVRKCCASDVEFRHSLLHAPNDKALENQAPV